MRDMRLRSFPSDTPMGRSSRFRGRATSMIRRRPGISILHRLYAEGEMSPIRLYQNPGKIDLTGRYRSRHLLGRLYLKEGMHPSFAGESGTYRIEILFGDEAVAERDLCALHGSGAPFDPDDAPLRGNYNDIPEEVMTSFSATGIIHILSVSGSHVALLFGFLYLLGRWLSAPRRLVILPAILLVLFYAVLSGLVPPVIRAAVMGILSVVGIFLDRERATLNLLGAAVFGMLLWDPYYVYDVSFQLSVGASAGDPPLLPSDPPLDEPFSQAAEMGEGRDRAVFSGAASHDTDHAL